LKGIQKKYIDELKVTKQGVDYKLPDLFNEKMKESKSENSQHRCYMTYVDKDSEVRIYSRN